MILLKRRNENEEKVLSIVLAAVMTLGMAQICVAESNDSKEFEGVSLRFLDVSPSESRQAYYEEAFAKFEEETGISVTYESVPWDDAANKITVLGASDQLPDVLTTHSGWLGQLTGSEWIIPLTDYLGDSTEEYTTAVNKLFWQSEKDRYGDIYTIPDGMMVKGIFVRKDWCEELGIELDPEKGWTYDEYFDVVQKLTDPEKNVMGCPIEAPEGHLIRL